MKLLEEQQARLNEIVLRDNFEPTAIVLEGRDTAGKSSTIRELTHYLPTPRYSVVLSTKPSKSTMNNWLGYWAQKCRNLESAFMTALGILAAWFKKLMAGALISNTKISCATLWIGNRSREFVS